MKNCWTLFFFLTANSFILKGQNQSNATNPPYEVQVFLIDEAIKIDGRLDEPEWQDAEMLDSFMQQTPDEGEPASEKTEVRVMYDNQFLYIGAKLYDSTVGPHIISSLQRDYEFAENDAFAVIIGPFDDGMNGFLFSVNPMNIQLEALVTNGDNLEIIWDNVWFSATQVFEDRWEVEIAIPFKTLRFTEGTESWKINFLRNDLKNFESSSWVPVPIHQDFAHLAFTGYLHWDKTLKKQGPNISLIPYLAANTSKNHEAGTASEQATSAGMDAKIAITPSLNLDLTVNPDFSAVEVDQQQTNLDRFELFFPERRQFFLENADLFADYGFSDIRPFFSRRIGLVSDSLGRTSENRIIYGARLNGKVGDDLRVGLMNMQTASDQGLGIPGQNFTVGTFQKNVFSRSSINGIMVNRQTTNTSEAGTTLPDYNRLVGVDYNLATVNDKWNGNFFFHRSFSPMLSGNEFAHGSDLRYNTKNLEVYWKHEHVGENFNAEVGYVPRLGYWRVAPNAEFRIFPTGGSPILTHRFKVYYNLYKDQDFDLKTDEQVTFNYRMEWRNTSSLNFRIYNQFIYLFFPFDPTRTGGEQIPENTNIRYTRAGLTYTSDTRKFFNYQSSMYYGGFYNGTRFYWRNEVNYRVQPYGTISLFAEHNRINLPDPYASANLWLVGPRFEVSFTDQLFLSTFIQYNNQQENININTRFQWRFKPVSDLFIVYTENYFPENLNIKTRSLVLRLSYWLNI